MCLYALHLASCRGIQCATVLCLFVHLKPMLLAMLSRSLLIMFWYWVWADGPHPLEMSFTVHTVFLKLSSKVLTLTV